MSAPDDVVSNNEAGHAGRITSAGGRDSYGDKKEKPVKIKREPPAKHKPNKTNMRKKLPRKCKHIHGAQNGAQKEKVDSSTSFTVSAKTTKDAQKGSVPDTREEPGDRPQSTSTGDKGKEDPSGKEAVIEARKPWFWRRATENDIRQLCQKADITYFPPPENRVETPEEKRKRMQSMKHYLKLARKGYSNKNREASLVEFLRYKMKYNQTEIEAILPFMSKKVLSKRGVNENVLKDIAALFYCAYAKGMDLANSID